MQDTSLGKARAAAGSMRMRRLNFACASAATWRQRPPVRHTKPGYGGTTTGNCRQSDTGAAGGELTAAAHAHQSLFADRFMEKQYECSPPPDHKRSRQAEMAGDARARYAPIPYPPGAGRSVAAIQGEPASRGQPRPVEPRPLPTGIPHSGTQSIPFKSSPRQPLLAKRHTVRATPAGRPRPRWRVDAASHSLDTTKATSAGSTTLRPRREPICIPSARSVCLSEELCPIERCSPVKNTPSGISLSHKSSGYASLSAPSGTRVPRKRHSSLPVSHQCSSDFIRGGGRGRGGEGGGVDNRHTSDEHQEGNSRRYRYTWQVVADEKMHDALMGEGLSLEDNEPCDLQVESLEELENSLEETEENGEGFSEDGLTDLDEESAGEDGESIHDPFACIQQSTSLASKAVNQGGFLGEGLTSAVKRELACQLQRLEVERVSAFTVPVLKSKEGERAEEGGPPRSSSEPLPSVGACCATTESAHLPAAVSCSADASCAMKTEGASTPPTLLTSLDGPRGCEQPSPPLTPSLFPGIQPTIHFPLPSEAYSGTSFTKEQRALLKWKMSNITPDVITSCIARVGFSKCSKGSGWLGYWGKHMRPEAFKGVKEYQKVNHFPGTFQMGRKDRLWRNVSRMQSRVGKKECDFVPLTFVLPADLRLLKREWEEGTMRQNKWILKPPAAARGIGIRVVYKWSQVPKKKPVIVQRYLADPFLINGSKFDLRVYVYVSSYEPLRIYVFSEGLTRFATCKYSHTMQSLSNRFAHLTNYSINKRNATFTPNSDETVCQGHKWGLLALWRYMKTELGIDPSPIWEAVKDLVVKTIISCEPHISPLVRTFVRKRFSCHELFGFDIMLDRRLKPWLLEVNVSPSLHSNSQLDLNIKGRMMRDVLNMASFRFPTREQLASETDHRTTHSLSVAEKAKHSHFLHKSLPESERHHILDSPTPEDLRVLAEVEDELARCGSFQRVFPCPGAIKYRKFFERERYLNILLEEWTAKYHSCADKSSVSRLKELMVQQAKSHQTQAGCRPKIARELSSQRK